MTEPLDLSLTSEEIYNIVLHLMEKRNKALTDELTAEELAAQLDAIAEAARDKAAWWIVGWLNEHGEQFYTHKELPDEMLSDTLEAAGIQKPEAT